MKNGNQLAFPTVDTIHPQTGERCEPLNVGLTKREYFAGLAMQATDLELYANSHGHKWAEEVAKDSVKMADALLKELENQNP
jgi:hypothetical protein